MNPTRLEISIRLITGSMDEWDSINEKVHAIIEKHNGEHCGAGTGFGMRDHEMLFSTSRIATQALEDIRKEFGDRLDGWNMGHNETEEM